MEMQMRRHRPLQDQENLITRDAAVGKTAGGLRTRSGLGQRGVLGDLSNNLQQRTDVAGKIAATAIEFEKKATISRATLRSATYKHVQSKVDTGLSTRPLCGAPAAGAVAAPAPSARPPLRREESTGAQAARAIIQRAKASSILGDRVRSKESIPEAIPNNERKTERKSLDVQKPKQQSLKPLVTRRSKEKAESAKPDIFSTPKLPPNVEDVDAGDDNSPLLLSIYIKDIYNYLRSLEVKYTIEPDHLKKQVAVTGRMRATLVDWLVEVQRQFNLLLETFQMTVGIIDRYLQVKPDVPRSKLQLVGVTSMFIASKYEEIYAPEVGDFIFVTDNAYTKADIYQCERDILSKLEFCLGRPLPLHFIRRFVKVAEGNSRNHHLAKYFVDLCLVEYTTAHYRPSELAAAAMWMSIYLLSDGSQSMEEMWTPTLQYYSGYTSRHLRPIVCKIARVVLGQESSKLKAVQQRYREPSLASVAALPLLKSKTMEELTRTPPCSPRHR